MADKKFVTPTHFGTYLKEINNSTIDDFESSKAKLAKDIKKQLSTNYEKQVKNLKEQLETSKELYKTTVLDQNKNYIHQTQSLKEQHPERQPA